MVDVVVIACLLFVVVFCFSLFLLLYLSCFVADADIFGGVLLLFLRCSSAVKFYDVLVMIRSCYVDVVLLCCCRVVTCFVVVVFVLLLLLVIVLLSCCCVVTCFVVVVFVLLLLFELLLVSCCFLLLSRCWFFVNYGIVVVFVSLLIFVAVTLLFRCYPFFLLRCCCYGISFRTK